MKKSVAVVAGIAGAIVVGVVGIYVASPWFAASALADAAQKGDKAKLEALVDFPAVKEGLKSQMNSVVMSAMQNDPEMAGNPFAGLAMMVVPAIVNSAVDMMVTPEGIQAMAKAEPTPAAASDASAEAPASKVNAPKHSQSYITLDRFRSRAAQEGSPENYIDFVFERRNLFSWKLVNVQMSDGLLKSSTPTGVAHFNGDAGPAPFEAGLPH